MEINNEFKNSLDVVKVVSINQHKSIEYLFMIILFVQVNLCKTTESDSDDDLEDEILLTTSSSAKDVPIRNKYFVERVVNNYTRKEFQQNFRIQIEAYEFLLAEITKVYKERFPNYTALPIDKQLLAVIWILANRECYRYNIFAMHPYRH